MKEAQDGINEYVTEKLTLVNQKLGELEAIVTNSESAKQMSGQDAYNARAIIQGITLALFNARSQMGQI